MTVPGVHLGGGGGGGHVLLAWTVDVSVRCEQFSGSLGWILGGLFHIIFKELLLNVHFYVYVLLFYVELVKLFAVKRQI